LETILETNPISSFIDKVEETDCLIDYLHISESDSYSTTPKEAELQYFLGKIGAKVCPEGSHFPTSKDDCAKISN